MLSRRLCDLLRLTSLSPLSGTSCLFSISVLEVSRQVHL